MQSLDLHRTLFLHFPFPTAIALMVVYTQLQTSMGWKLAFIIQCVPYSGRMLQDKPIILPMHHEGGTKCNLPVFWKTEI